MPYIINRTDGTILSVVEDGTIDTATDLRLIGKNYIGFGKSVNDNFVALLENFSSDTAPNSPLDGQLWWDRANQQIKVFNGTIFKPLGILRVANTAPIGSSVGDLWYDTSKQQLRQYTGSEFNLIGPAYSADQGDSGILVETLSDGFATYVVTKILNGGSIIAIVSSDDFVPLPSIPGFANIRAGFNLNSLIDLKYYGTVANSEKVGNVAANQFIRNDQPSSTLGSIEIANDNGLVVGTQQQISLTAVGSLGLLTNNSINGNIKIRVNKGISFADAIVVDGATGNVSISNLQANVVGNLVGNVTGTVVGDVVGNVVGNSSTATRWSTPRTLTLTGDVTGTATIDGSQNITVVTDASGSLPAGIIVMWSGSASNVPTRWHLCDGTNGTPDLRDKFVVGAGGSYAVGNTDASTTRSVTLSSNGAHNHTGAAGSTTLTVSQMPEHAHLVDDAQYSEIGGATTYNDPVLGPITTPRVGSNSGADYDNGPFFFRHNTFKTGNSQPHTHTIATDGAHSHSGTVSVVPPYYALCYIMKVA